MTLLMQQVSKDKWGKWLSEYKCKCGKIVCAREYYVNRGMVTSCGCTRYRKKFASPKLRARTWYDNNKDLCKTRGQLFYQNNKERIKSKAMLRLYGITLQEYNDISALQENRCKICNSSGRQLFIDHRHSDGFIRGLLCNQCNFLLGNCKDSVLTLQSAINYLGGSLCQNL